MNRTTQPDISTDFDAKHADAAALGVLVKMSVRKRLLIRVIEAILRPLVAGVEWVRRQPGNAGGEVFKILVMEYWNLGDLVMLTPFLRSMRIQYPDASITLLTSPNAAPLMEQQGLVDQVLTVRVPWTQHYSRRRKYNPFSPGWLELLRMVRFLRAQRFDLAFTARADIRENFILWLARAARRVGYGFGGGGFLLTDTVIPDLQHPHFSNRWLRLLEYVGKPALVRQPNLRVTPEEEKSAQQYLGERGLHDTEFLIGIHPGARSAVRQWGEENFLTLAQRLQARFPINIVWFQDPNRTPAIADGNQLRPLSLPLRQFMAVLSRCRLLICNDSGPMHIATALGVPVVAVFGPTEPAWFGPLGQENRVVSQPGFWCRPCFDYCLFDQPYCLRTIGVEPVFEASVEALNSLLFKTKQGATSNESTIRVAQAKETA
ncbi:MAG: glycosyltransferase family 9 protein [Terriglobia bacterium]